MYPVQSESDVKGSSDVKEGVHLMVENLNYTVLERKTKKPKTILDSITFAVEPGVLFAIMGPSGSGKTSVLNALAGRIRVGGARAKGCSLTARLYCDGPAEFSDIRACSNYVMQSDNLLPFLTVRETLTFAAELKLYYMTKAERDTQIVRVMRELGLETCADVLVGGKDTKKGISGGEKKRVAIAIELLDNPRMLLVDEPTTGLDSSLAYDVAYVLVRLAREGRTVVCTIHQPRSQVFALFDQLMLLNEGKCVYQGPTEHAADYFKDLGYRCPPSFNPADYLLDLLSPKTIVEDDRAAADKPPGPSSNGTPGGTSRLGRLSSLGLRRSCDALSVDPAHASGQLSGEVGSDSPGEGGVKGIKFERVYTSVEAIKKLPDQFNESALAQQLQQSMQKTWVMDEQRERESPQKKGMNDFFMVRMLRCRLGDNEGTKQAPAGRGRGGIQRWCANFRTLVRKNALNSMRNPTKSYLNLAVHVIFGLLLGGVFIRLPMGGATPQETRMAVTNVLGMIFVTACQHMFANYDSLLTFPADRMQFNRDVANNLYTPSAYYIAKSIADAPYQHIPGLFFSLITFFMAGLGPEAYQFFEWLLFTQVITFSACGFLYMIGASVAKFENANILAPVATILFMMVSGFYLKDSTIPAWIAWFRHINYFRYGFFALVRTQYPEGGSVGWGAGKMSNEQVLEELAVIPKALSRWLCMIITLAIGFVFRLWAFLAFKYMNRHIGLEE